MSGQQTIQVRTAHPKDVVNICKLLTGGWNEQTVEYAPVDDLRGYKWILGIIETGMIAVADLNGRIVGAACASPYQPPWSRVWMLEMEFLYIMPNFRGAGVAQKLIDAVEGFADRYDLTLTFTIATGEKAAIKDRMMRQAGWNYVGGNFLRPRHGKGKQNNSEE